MFFAHLKFSLKISPVFVLFSYD